MSTANDDQVPIDWKAWSEQCIKARSRSCCFCGCLLVLVLFICCIVLLLFYIVNFDPLRGKYPVMPNVEQDPENAKGNVRLLVGTWQLESIQTYFLSRSATPVEWEKTRLEIRPDHTFILTDPYEGLDYLLNFRGMITGKWEIGYSEHFGTIMIIFKHETDLPIDWTGFPARIRNQDLWTLRENDTSDEYLRLHPCLSEDEDGFPQNTPSWKKVIEE